MFDWNGDALFHTVIDKQDSNQETNTSHTSRGCLGWIVSTCPAFRRHMKDIIEYRIMEYYRRRYTESEKD